MAEPVLSARYFTGKGRKKMFGLLRKIFAMDIRMTERRKKEREIERMKKELEELEENALFLSMLLSQTGIFEDEE